MEKLVSVALFQACLLSFILSSKILFKAQIDELLIRIVAYYLTSSVSEVCG